MSAACCRPDTQSFVCFQTMFMLYSLRSTQEIAMRPVSTFHHRCLNENWDGVSTAINQSVEKNQSVKPSHPKAPSPCCSVEAPLNGCASLAQVKRGINSRGHSEPSFVLISRHCVFAPHAETQKKFKSLKSRSEYGSGQFVS